MNTIKVLNNEDIRNRFADLMNELARHHDLKISDDFGDEWWGYNETSQNVWIVLETPSHLEGSLCLSLGPHDMGFEKYILTDPEGEEFRFNGYAAMIRNTLCRACGCEICDCVKSPAKKCDISADHLLCEDCDECIPCGDCPDVHCVDDMDFGTRSEPCCGICGNYCNDAEWEYCGDLDDCDSDFDEDEQPDEDFTLGKFQHNICDCCVEEYSYDDDGAYYYLKSNMLNQ